MNTFDQLNKLSKLPQVKICSICLKVNDPEFSQYSPNVSDKIKKEMVDVLNSVQVVRKQGKEGTSSIGFSDGMCLSHAKAMYAAYGYDTTSIQKSDVPCLVEDSSEAEKLRQSYIQGIFTQEQLQNVQQNQQQVNESLITRFRTLAGIRG